jgi:hypothetical protein
LHEVQLPDLAICNVKLGENETPWDLRSLLYKGGAKARVNLVAGMIDAGEFGQPLFERISLIEKIREEIHAALVGGGSKETARTLIEYLRDFFGWVDKSSHSLDLDTVANTYLHWTDHLVHRFLVNNDLSERAAYHSGRMVGRVLDGVLERGSPLIMTTRLRKPQIKRTLRGVEADKQNIEETFKFGNFLLDIMDGLPLDKVYGSLPVRIPLRSGQELVEWSMLKPPGQSRWANPQNAQNRYYAKKLRAKYENNKTLHNRYPIVNLRIVAELLFFIAQTGMNLAQAHQLKIRHYSYKSTIDGYLVRDYKHRRKGEVLFEIFSEYKTIFERYLEWRKAIFPRDPDGLLFPLVRKGKRADDKPPTFNRAIRLCREQGICFVPPSKLRITRINWLLRRSGDADLTAEQAQHTKQTLIRVYEEPSLQRTMTEIVRYWQATDPSISPPAPGVCIGSPMPIEGIPQFAIQPDCIRPSGCLWCEHHRDIDSLDFIWSVSCFRHLKSIELANYHPPQPSKTKLQMHPALLVIERLSDKLRWFQQSNAVRRKWVEESLLRIEEGDYHPAWSNLISAEEGGLLLDLP